MGRGIDNSAAVSYGNILIFGLVAHSNVDGVDTFCSVFVGHVLSCIKRVNGDLRGVVAEVDSCSLTNVGIAGCSDGKGILIVRNYAVIAEKEKS
ncbi:hypothetical protein McpAg1_18920 [Methanocorpusculaceae archaeon Ag1]|uniref:Uncharacterized protein n=1 Tax=Methanorbis furvi TaxID=3028299 RepID=A0AAE4MFQ2_9EURY|nr:hypothetical protein [Methanocorpusculaceae archaeon Ag1]